MSVVATCSCDTIGNPAELRFCVPCHHYFYGDKRLTGVTSVIKDVLPPDYSGVDEDTLEKARHRGVALDALASAYAVGKPLEIPAGTREDVIEESKALFEKFANWFDRQGFRKVESQVTVFDSEVAGTIDIRADGDIYDVKGTYDILPKHHLQVGGYQDLNDGGRAVLIHVTKRYKTPKIIETNSRADWNTVRAFWQLTRRLGRRA